MSVRFSVLLSAAALLALGGCGGHRPLAAQPAAPSTEPFLIAAARANGYVAEIRFDTAADQHVATIRRDGSAEALWSHRGLRMNLGPATPELEEGASRDERDDVPPGAVRDLDGDGVPELVLREWTGGAHCCFTLFVFSLGPTLQVLDTVPLGHSDGVEIADVDGDGRAEIQAREWAFAYWNESFMGSPAPAVTLSLTDDGYRIAQRVQRRPALTDGEMRGVVVAIRAAWTPDLRFPPTELWSAMLDMVYRGQAQQVAPLLDCTWPGDALGREVFGRYVRDQLFQSEWYEQVDALNDRGLDVALRAEPKACAFPAG